MTERRGFLGSILALATPPAFVSAGVLMPIKTPLHILWADGGDVLGRRHCDAEAIEAWGRRERVLYADGRRVGDVIEREDILLGRQVWLRPHSGATRILRKCVIRTNFTDDFQPFNLLEDAA